MSCLRLIRKFEDESTVVVRCNSCGSYFKLPIEQYDDIVFSGYTSCSKCLVNSRRKMKIGTHQPYGMLRPISRVYGDSGSISVLCKCDCGNIVIRLEDSVSQGYTKSCGCKKGKFYEFVWEGENDYTVTDDDILSMDSIVKSLDSSLKVKKSSICVKSGDLFQKDTSFSVSNEKTDTKWLALDDNVQKTKSETTLESLRELYTSAVSKNCGSSDVDDEVPFIEEPRSVIFTDIVTHTPEVDGNSLSDEDLTESSFTLFTDKEITEGTENMGISKSVGLDDRSSKIYEINLEGDDRFEQLLLDLKDCSFINFSIDFIEPSNMDLNPVIDFLGKDSAEYINSIVSGIYDDCVEVAVGNKNSVIICVALLNYRSTKVYSKLSASDLIYLLLSGGIDK